MQRFNYSSQALSVHCVNHSYQLVCQFEFTLCIFHIRTLKYFVTKGEKHYPFYRFTEVLVHRSISRNLHLTPNTDCGYALYGFPRMAVKIYVVPTASGNLSKRGATNLPRPTWRRPSQRSKLSASPSTISNWQLSVCRCSSSVQFYLLSFYSGS